jgi:small subunit ribosomal protein S20
MADDKKKLPAKRPTAAKRDIQNKKKHLQNKCFKSRVKTAVKSYVDSAEKKEKEAPALLNSVYALIDKGVKKGVFHINKASRQKAKLSKKIAS